MNGTTPKSITNIPVEIEVHPAQPVQHTDRNLVHVTKAQMKGDSVMH